MPRRISSVVLTALSGVAGSGVTGCQGPNPDVAVICHNANCVRPLESARDDTLETLQASLALKFKGRPVIDGVELDLLWSPETNSCLFAHDPDQQNAAPAEAAAELVAAALERPGPVTWNDGPFYLKLELKPGVDPTDNNSHVACALDVYAMVRDASECHGRRLKTFFDAKNSDLLATLAAHPSWPKLSADEDVHLSAAFTIPGIGSSSPLSDFHAPYDTVSLHPDWISSATLDALRSQDIAITLWAQSLAPRQLRAIAEIEPVFVSTGDAELLRRWLGD